MRTIGAGIAVIAALFSACAPSSPLPDPSPSSLPDGWIERVTELRWIDYSPSAGFTDDTFNPTTGSSEGILPPSDESIAADLEVLRTAGFTGLVTYGPPSLSHLSIIEAAGFEGVIVGIWDPTREEELQAAEAAASSPLVLGYCIGNEGIMFGNYEFADLEATARRMRATGLPITTTEMSQQYRIHPELLSFGDWVFPNIHPFHSQVLDPARAVEWTQEEFDSLADKTDRFILIKETGLPHDGTSGVSEERQLEFYIDLAETDVPFVYFEGFDVAWKDWASYEPYWGIFHGDRTPTLLGEYLIGLD